MIPDYWRSFVTEHSLTGSEIEIPEDADLSGLGAEFQVLDETGIREEAEKAYPGIVVAKDGFVPVGGCVVGAGDPYFINTNDGPNGPLYRVYHDMVSEGGYKREQAVDVVLQHYEQMAEYLAE